MERAQLVLAERRAIEQAQGSLLDGVELDVPRREGPDRHKSWVEPIERGEDVAAGRGGAVRSERDVYSLLDVAAGRGGAFGGGRLRRARRGREVQLVAGELDGGGEVERGRGAWIATATIIVFGFYFGPLWDLARGAAKMLLGAAGRRLPRAAPMVVLAG